MTPIEIIYVSATTRAGTILICVLSAWESLSPRRFLVAKGGGPFRPVDDEVSLCHADNQRFPSAFARMITPFENLN